MKINYDTACSPARKQRILNSKQHIYQILMVNQGISDLVSLSLPGQVGTKKEYRIMNKEQGTPNIEGRRRFAPYFYYKRNRASGAPSFDIPCSIFDILSFLFHLYTFINQHISKPLLIQPFKKKCKPVFEGCQHVC